MKREIERRCHRRAMKVLLRFCTTLALVSAVPASADIIEVDVAGTLETTRASPRLISRASLGPQVAWLVKRFLSSGP
jgi:hypothetical protein